MGAIHFHRQLNPKLWAGEQLHPPVRLKLFQAALAFYKFLDVDKLAVSDILLTGSNAAYNYTDLSDIDVHLVVDFATSVCPELASNLFLTKKALWSSTYDVEIHGLPVELYVEDEAEPVKASGVFSIIHNQWLKIPSPERPVFDDTAVHHKHADLAAQIDALLNGQPTIEQIDRVLNRLRQMRQCGLLHGGEWSVENLTYKALRDGGELRKLTDRRIELRDRALSL